MLLAEHNTRVATLFATLDARLPPLVRTQLPTQGDIVYLFAFDDSQSPNGDLLIYRNLEDDRRLKPIDVDRAWMIHDQLWFRQCPVDTRSKYEAFASYLRDWRPAVKVNLSAPLALMRVGPKKTLKEPVGMGIAQTQSMALF